MFGLTARLRGARGAGRARAFGWPAALFTAFVLCGCGGGKTSPPKVTAQFVQIASADPAGTQTSVTATFAAAQGAGHLNVVVIGWGDAAAQVSSVTDSAGNSYLLAVGPTASGTDATQSIYYAQNTAAAAAGANAVTVTFDSDATAPDLRIVEYSGIDPTAALDTAAGASGTGLTSSASVTTTNANDLLIGANYVSDRSMGAGSSYTSRILTTPDGDLVEDRTVTAAGAQTATATLTGSGWWIMQVVAFRAAAASSDTKAPTAPSQLTASAKSSAEIDLAWAASTDDTGVTGYLVERCQGAGCSSFAQVGTATTASFSDTGLPASTSYSYRVRATDAAGNLGGYSNVAQATTGPPDKTPPTAPSNLVAVATASSQIGLTWTAATDDVAVTGYQIERCLGSGCSSFAQVGTASTASFADAALIASTAYSYRVRAADAAGNLGPYSNVARATTPAPPTPPEFVQVASDNPPAPTAMVTAAFASAQAAGDLNVVIIAWDDTTTPIMAVTDTKGNSYHLAVTMKATGFASQSIYYAANIAAAAAGANTVTVTFAAAAPFPDLRILEYSGISGTSPLDVTAAANGNGTTADTGPATTTNAEDLLVAGDYVGTTTAGAGTGFTQRVLTTPAGDLAEDMVVSAAGSYDATAMLSGSGDWIIEMAAFRAGLAGPDTAAPTAPANLAAAATSNTQISLSWTPSIDDVGVSKYLVERCQGSGCTTFTQVGTSTGAGYADSGLAAGTSYSYRVRASDAAGNLSAYSNVATTATMGAVDTQAPTTPSGLMATAVSGSQINLAWAASSDNVGVASYLVERCQGASCTTFAQVRSSAVATFSDSGLTAGTSYSYRVRASDAAGNLSGYSNLATATTTPPDTTPPSAPANLVATFAGKGQIDLTWTASTDDVGVTGYLVERCQGASCTSFAQVGTATTSSFDDTGLSAGTSYSYRVRATDAAGNRSAYSDVATVSTVDSAPPSAPSNLVAVALSPGQISLSWTASSDNVGVTKYLVERCQGAGCTGFVEIDTAFGPAFTDGNLTPSTSYSYRVRATDAGQNLSGYSNTATASTTPVTNHAYVQGNFATPQTAVKSVTVTFTAAQVAGDLNVLVASWSDVVNTVVSVTDSAGNVYARALAPTIVADTSTQVMYYAKAILAASAGSNQVTITWSGSAAFPDVRIAEYTGVDQTNPLDTASGKWGTGPLAESGPLVTTGAPDLIVAGSYSAGLAIGPGVGYTQRLLTTPDGDILEDTVGYAANSYTATVPMATTAWWIVQAAAFRLSAAPVTDSTPPVVTINSPAAGDTVSGVMTADISATDAGAVQAVQLLVDGLPMGFAEIYAPYDLFVNTALFANGPHVLTAYAWDEFENVGTSASVTVTFYNPSPGNPAQDGMWTGTVPSPIVSTASALLPGGRVLFWDGQSQGWDARVWDPRFNMFFIDTPAPSNIFCVGLEQTADGRVLVVGGHVTGHTGITAANVFDPDTLAWTPLAQMVYPRWYPTLTELPDGRFIVQSGETNCDGCDVATPEIFDLAANTWTELSGSQFKFNFYPHSFVLPDGRLLVSSNIETPMVSQVLDLGTGAWTAIGGPAVDGGSAVMYLPGKVLKTGTTFDPGDTGTASSASAYVLDATQPSPTWQQVASMNMPLSYHTMTMLPDGTVLLTGGGLTTAATDTANAVLHPQIWSPTTQTFTTLGSTMNAPRLYHSSALLMPDGRVLAAGGGRADDVTASTDQFSNEFFAPPYLFKGPRPVITSAPTTVPYGQQFVVQTPDAARIGQVSLIRYGATTHTVDMGQRFVPLTFAVGTGSLTVTAPPNGNWAPPGNYMLFIVDTTGVPSVAATVRL